MITSTNDHWITIITAALRRRSFFNELQTNLDSWMKLYNEDRPHQGEMVLREDSDANFHRQHSLG